MAASREPVLALLPGRGASERLACSTTLRAAARLLHGKVFERICSEAFIRHHEAWGLTGALQWARWEGKDCNRRPIEIDLVARLDDGRILTGEIKWSSRPMNVQVHADLLRDLEDLSRSGLGWAKDARSIDSSAGHVYFSAAGFAPAFVERVRGDERIRLLSLKDLYA